MKFIKSYFLLFSILFAVAVLPACKAKKPIVTRPPVTYPPDPQPVKRETPPPAAPVQQETPPPPPPVAKPDYNFKNIQFEFNSGILKTDSYPTLDKIAAEIKKDPSVKFVLNGNSSAEGSADHNMALSVERANSVKLYLVNSGISGDNLAIKGYGESKPVADNSTEEGRVLNRRVEIKKQ
ncbi:OmpA family protein [Mucilaginibacter sp. BJC16-A38]|uniref:OmpA family protein n=1 Tax=Mucilaginibacter phenanthrenivorans TaxID=1234842 RepID=UPI0021581816|nr:OmpA family protein [Mucilaginibacter phenanthrenivorans]MCR8558367.1 OmpA family protein [Mucilaginibacter phenanthrenivorans]